MRCRKSAVVIAMIFLLQGRRAAEAQAPRQAPAAPPPPAAGDAQKPTGDALAQEAEAKPKEPEDEKKEKEKKKPALTGHLAAGLTFTNGNSSTRTFNLALGLEYDPRTGNVIKADGFYIDNREDGVSSVDRTSAHLRDEYAVGPRWFAFADLQFIKDRFKEIDSLISPTAGVGLHLVKTEKQELSADFGVGAVIERDEGQDRKTSGAVRAGETYLWKISPSANFVANAFALWKTADTADAYYHLELALGAAVNDHAELKVALIDEYKRKPPDPAIKKNDVAGIVSVGYKF